MKLDKAQALSYPAGKPSTRKKKILQNLILGHLKLGVGKTSSYFEDPALLLPATGVFLSTLLFTLLTHCVTACFPGPAAVF